VNTPRTKQFEVTFGHILKRLGGPCSGLAANQENAAIHNNLETIQPLKELNMSEQHSNFNGPKQRFHSLRAKDLSRSTRKWLFCVFAFLLITGITLIDALRAAEAVGRDVNYRSIAATGFWSNAGAVPADFDPAFGQALYGWTGSKSGSAASFHLVVRPSGKYLLAIGFFDPQTTPGARLQDIVIDGRKVDTLDPAGPRPTVRLYDAADRNGDGYLQVSCSHVKDECGATGLMNIVWLFEADQRGKVDAEKLARGNNSIKPLFRLDAASADRQSREHINFPKLPETQQKRMLPLRPVALGIVPARPQPVDPLHLEIQGELRNRIRLVLDRWGYAGRDQKLVAGFLADAGFDTSARALEVYCMFSRLMKVDLDLQVPFEALLSRQQRSGELAGAFPGGAGVPRLACSWEQGTLLQAMLAYYEHSGGDPRALEAARQIVEWEDRMISGKLNGDQIIEALRPVEDPELRRSIVDLGMVRHAALNDDGIVDVQIALTVAGCPLRNEITNRVTAAVAPLPGVRKVTLDFTNAPLDAVIDYLREISGMNIFVDTKVRDKQMTITMKVNELSLRSIFGLMLKPQGCDVLFKDGVLQVMTKEDVADKTMRMEIYDCRDILHPIAQFPGVDLDLSQGAGILVTQPDVDAAGEMPIEEMVRAHTGGRSWEENSKAVVKMQNGLLVIKNTPEVHKQVRRLLDLLRANK
jgi:metal-sulfur cluster biosynthetic enzyme